MHLSVQNSGETLLNAHQSVSDFSEVNGRVIAQRQATTPLTNSHLNLLSFNIISNTTDRKRSFEW